MDLNITSKNIELTPDIRSYVERKLGKMNRYLPNIIKSEVEIFEEKTRSPRQHYVVQVTLDSSGTLLRGEERGDDLYTAIDRVADIMSRQIERYKGKRDKRGRTESIRTESAEMATPELEPVAREIVKVKRFAVKPMPVEEALEQMELLDHDFFLFINADSSQFNLLYRRKDGNYGLIQPEIT